MVMFYMLKTPYRQRGSIKHHDQVVKSINRLTESLVKDLSLQVRLYIKSSVLRFLASANTPHTFWQTIVFWHTIH